MPFWSTPEARSGRRLFVQRRSCNSHLRKCADGQRLIDKGIAERASTVRAVSRNVGNNLTQIILRLGGSELPASPCIDELAGLFGRNSFATAGLLPGSLDACEELANPRRFNFACIF